MLSWSSQVAPGSIRKFESRVRVTIELQEHFIRMQRCHEVENTDVWSTYRHTLALLHSQIATLHRQMQSSRICKHCSRYCWAQDLRRRLPNTWCQFRRHWGPNERHRCMKNPWTEHQVLLQVWWADFRKQLRNISTPLCCDSFRNMRPVE